MKIIANGNDEEPFPYNYWKISEEQMDSVSIERDDKIFITKFHDVEGETEVFLEVYELVDDPLTEERELGDIICRLFLDAASSQAEIEDFNKKEK